ncbi:MAG: putative baseplate assembly protein, partial [Nitrospirae bacterium]|nr:putative baseplate assembly protein [Nitrospirota bacterium]
MSLPKPELDDLTFEQLVSEARGLIPRFAPQWTDHNITDPGITLIELLAWLTETDIYRLNLIAETHLRKYLHLLGIIPESIKPATMEVTFKSGNEVEVNVGHLLSTELEGKRFYFELAHPVKVVPVSLKKVVTDEITGVFDRTDFNSDPELFFAPFGETSLNGAAVYLGFDGPSEVLSLFIDLYENDLIPAGRHGNEEYYRFKNAELTWEYSLTDKKWQEIIPSVDETDGFKFSGRVVFEGIDTNKWSDFTLPFFDYNHYWLRCVLKKSSFEYPPRIKTVRLNTAKAIHGRTIRTEEKFRGTGLPGQVYELKNRPVLKGSVVLAVDGEPWQEREDLYGSTSQDRHFILNSAEGTIVFGDGLMGAVPSDGAEIVVKQYRTGGGNDGNLPAGLTWTAEGYQGIEIINHTPAEGGKGEESTEEARLRFLKDLRTPYRAVTSEDFEYIAKNTPGLRIAQTKAIVNEKTVMLVVVPYTPLETFQKPPLPSEGLLNAVCRHLDSHRLLGTSIKVVGPEYIKVQV